MTIVVTTASKYGISVVGDRAVSRRHGTNPPTVLKCEARKVFYSQSSNMALACWGNTEFAGEDYAQWVSNWSQNQLSSAQSLANAGNELANDLNTILEPLAVRYGGWGTLHRGIHLSGYDDGLPCIFHIHTGDRATGYHRLEMKRDFPDEHGGGNASYKEKLSARYKAQVFNGFHELFQVVGKNIDPLRIELEKQFEVTIPAPTLYGQYAMDLAVVQFAAVLLRAAGHSPQVSESVNGFAFSQEGLARFPEADSSPPLKPRPSDLRGVTTASINLDISRLRSATEDYFD